jgi:hypothetical protein
MPAIMVNNLEYVTNNIGKLYLSIIMGISMVIIEIMMKDHTYSVLSIHLYIMLLGMLAIFIYLYRKQIGINDKQYLEGMIEHHSMPLLTSDEILKKTNDYDVAKLAKNIISTQTDELAFMKKILNKNNETK